MKNCECCGIEHDGLFGRGRFCSMKCAKTPTKETKEKISRGRSNFIKTIEKDLKKNESHSCVICSMIFVGYVRHNRDPKCNKCKRPKFVRKINKNNFSLMDLSSRTVSKIFKRSGIGCALCGWNEALCDTHHIVPTSKGGTNELDNLIYVCPNHHRLIHSNMSKYPSDELVAMSLKYRLPNWMDFYHIEYLQ